MNNVDNHSQLSSVMRRFFSMLAAIAVAAAMIGTTFFVGPKIEVELDPVLVNVAFVVVERRNGRMAVDWTGDRRRPECKLLRLSALVKRDGEWSYAVVSKTEESGDYPLKLSSRATGFQRFTRLDVIPDGDGVKFRLEYTCHPLWTTVMQVGFDMSAKR
jgi:hypothetical protein